MGLLSKRKENRIITNAYREEKKKQKKLMKHAREYDGKKSYGSIIRDEKGKWRPLSKNFNTSPKGRYTFTFTGEDLSDKAISQKKFQAYLTPGVDEAEFTGHNKKKKKKDVKL